MAELNAKILFWGLNHSGKSTNLQVIHSKLRQDNRGAIQEFEAGGATYQVLPIELGEVQGCITRFKLYALPGMLEASSIRTSLAQDAVGVVLVIDSQASKIPENALLYDELILLFEESGVDLKQFPVVIQYNKFDLPTAASIDELEEKINTRRFPFFKAVAKESTGVLSTLTTVSKGVVRYLKQSGIPIRSAPAERPRREPISPPEPPHISVRKISLAHSTSPAIQELTLQMVEGTTGKPLLAKIFLRTESTPQGLVLMLTPQPSTTK